MELLYNLFLLIFHSNFIIYVAKIVKKIDILEILIETN